MPEPIPGRIDVHSHLLPGVDDGCPTLEESLACARELVRAGYSHSFCTPHVWPNLPHNNVDEIPLRVRELQQAFHGAGVPLKLIPGAELNLRPDLMQTPPELIPTYGMAGKFCLFDIWVDRLPAYFWKGVEWLQAQGLTVILAHPERMRPVQDDPSLADDFARAGLLLQGNLQCFADAPHTHTRQTAERFLGEGRYFMLGTDLHNMNGLGQRMRGLERVIEAIGDEETMRLTRDHPLRLIAHEIRM